MKTWLYILITALAIGLISKFLLQNRNQTVKVLKLSFKDDKLLYLKSNNWGLTNDNKIIAISCDDSEGIDSTKTYYYKGEDFIFYRISEDTLYVYTYTKSNNPDIFKSDIKIIQTELDNVDMMNLKKDNSFKNKGLQEFK